MQSLQDKIIIVTGASSGIGERIAHHVANQGGFPVLLARRASKLKEIVQQLPGASAWYACDIADLEAIRETFARIRSEYGPPDALINNAGFGIFESVSDTPMNAFQSMFDVNVLGLIQCVKEVLPDMITKQYGHIINIASQAGKISTPKSSGYAATKHAVIGFTNSLRMEVKDHHIQVTGVNLGPVRTNFFDTADPEGAYQSSVERYMLDPDVVAKRIVQSLFTSKREVNMPGWMNVGAKLYQLMPGLMEVMLRNQFSKK
ncbi:SDR family NAD(P)-dependent oxidoreductase [Pontibacillus salicampi]|uniref:SDR family NAD(P)-dependent oxidoreductase n=1 Tax=Pontibacillus salicampi TaxID=1449801 RepID=A0ABV6LKW7_9BACI